MDAGPRSRDYLSSILGALSERGFRLVTLDEAFADPIYRQALPPSAEGGSMLIRLGEASGLLAQQ